MQTIILTSKGIEQFCVDELAELGIKGSARDRLVTCDCSQENLAKVTYRSQCAHRVGTVLFDEVVDNPLTTLSEQMSSLLEGQDTPKQYDCFRFGTHKFNSAHLRSAAIKAVAPDKSAPPESTILVIVVDKRLVIAKDSSGVDLSKRSYKVFSSAFSLKAPVAYALVRASGWNRQGKLLDPFCRDGTVAIEAGLWATNKSPRHYDKRKLPSKEVDLSSFDKESEFDGDIIASDSSFPNLSAAKKNAKVDNVHKAIDFRKYTPADLDLYFEPESINAIATSTNRITSTVFKRLEGIMAPGARLAVLVQNEENTVEQAQSASLQVVSTTKFWLGKRAHDVFVFEKPSKK